MFRIDRKLQIIIQIFSVVVKNQALRINTSRIIQVVPTFEQCLEKRQSWLKLKVSPRLQKSLPTMKKKVHQHLYTSTDVTVYALTDTYMLYFYTLQHVYILTIGPRGPDIYWNTL